MTLWFLLVYLELGYQKKLWHMYLYSHHETPYSVFLQPLQIVYLIIGLAITSLTLCKYLEVNSTIFGSSLLLSVFSGTGIYTLESLKSPVSRSI